MTKEETMAIMDKAAQEARQEFLDNILLEGGKAKAVANWVKKHYPTAGYKRLCKILIDLAD